VTLDAGDTGVPPTDILHDDGAESPEYLRDYLGWHAPCGADMMFF
jgi:hypothetical protein